jgi:hypothetical protein
VRFNTNNLKICQDRLGTNIIGKERSTKIRSLAAADAAASGAGGSGSAAAATDPNMLDGFTSLDWLAFGSLAGAQFSYTLGWGSVTGVLMSELMPGAVRGLGLSVAQSAGAHQFPETPFLTCHFTRQIK